MIQDTSNFIKFVYFNSDQFYAYSEALILFKGKKESDLAKEIEKEIQIKKIESEEAQNQYRESRIKEARSKLIRMRISRMRDIPSVEELGDLFKVTSIFDYHKLKTQFTFQNEENEEICFLHEIPVKEGELPANINEIYALWRDEIANKEKYKLKYLELEEKLNSMSSGSGISIDLKEKILDIFQKTSDFFNANFEVINSKKGKPEGGQTLFEEISKIEKELKK